TDWVLVIVSVSVPELLALAGIPEIAPSARSVQMLLPGDVSICQRSAKGPAPEIVTRKTAAPGRHVEIDAGCAPNVASGHVPRNRNCTPLMPDWIFALARPS